jgi:cytidylate kinase
MERLADMLGVDKNEADTRLKVIDDEHHDFFKAVYFREKTSSDEFDLIVNMDHIKSGHQVAQIIACAFEQKFQLNFKNK